ncbi:MAG: hypothetical protein JWO33_275 [Caulobacteraceae bacterium]|nr:hypothetical protein [Caulobacteraceae bacterium]
MEEFLIVGTTHLDTPVYMSELSSQTLHDNGLYGERAGLYLYEANDDLRSRGIRVLASVPDTDAAYRLLDLMGIRAV